MDETSLISRIRTYRVTEYPSRLSHEVSTGIFNSVRPTYLARSIRQVSQNETARPNSFFRLRSFCQYGDEEAEKKIRKELLKRARQRKGRRVSENVHTFLSDQDSVIIRSVHVKNRQS